ncbi:hypothetical protein [Kitasatospora sp. NPDC088346]|uniref:hypothetical protein n=1 Tax=Kitasatospora sp. NPDC088346 TaxID=3364073 RepID=UPI003830C512
MEALPRRTLLAAGAATAATLVAGCSGKGGGSGGEQSPGPDHATGATDATGQGPKPLPVVTLIGDGSTSDTGAQPNQPAAEQLKLGERPPQFVVFSWDGAGELDNKLFSRFRQLAKEHNAGMTFFFSGVYAVPEGKKTLYRPPQHPIGASDIGYLTDEHIHETLTQLGAAWLEGHEIGTHFNGHFCGPTGGAAWSPEDWDSEIEQAMSFVMNWKTNTGFDLPALPFDYRKELIGSRTPCLEGQRGLLPTAVKRNWKYDSSGVGGLQVWPQKIQGGALWDMPLQSIPFPGHTFQVLSMDYNIMYNQSGSNTKGDPARRAAWQTQARDSYLAGFERAYSTNRAPLIIGNHFEEWNGGIYMNAVEEVLKTIASRPEVRLVSFRQLIEWLEVQDPAVLRKLQALPMGQAPTGGWAEYLGGPGPSPSNPPASAQVVPQPS